MPKIYNTDVNVFDASVARLRAHFEAGDRVVVCTSGGKDSTIVLELALIAARQTGCLPLDVVTRDEEIMVPGTFEYCERIRERPEVRFHWLIAGQAILNAYNRFMPYWWVFDPVEKEQWVRQPPEWAEWIDVLHIDGVVTKDRFPTPEGKRLISVNGLRAQESLRRLTRIAHSGGAITKHPTPYGAYKLSPIYDFRDEDVWKAIYDNQWDYNHAYDQMFRIGIQRNLLRIAPPSMRQNMRTLPYFIKLWPKWFDRVARRVPGIRLAAHYGKRALRPFLLPGEDWQMVCDRLKTEAEAHNAPWMIPRIEKAITYALQYHQSHSTEPLAMTQKHRCSACIPTSPGSWQGLAESLYYGDPWGDHNKCLDALEPTVFRSDVKPWFADGKKGPLGW